MAFAAGTIPFYNSLHLVGGQTTTYTKVKEVRVGDAGTITVDFTLKNTVFGGTQYGRIYKNGVAVGTERSVGGTTTTTFSENITVAVGDLIQLYSKYAGSSGGQLYDFKFKSNAELEKAVALLDAGV